MKVAIIGTSKKMSMSQLRETIDICFEVLQDHGVELISGGAEGVDGIAEFIAKCLDVKTTVFKPEQSNWEGYKKRNIQIAQTCDELYCITTALRENEPKCYHHKPPQDHTKTAGCWTRNEAIKLKKPTDLMVLEER